MYTSENVGFSMDRIVRCIYIVEIAHFRWMHVWFKSNVYVRASGLNPFDQMVLDFACHAGNPRSILVRGRTTRNTMEHVCSHHATLGGS